MRDLFGEVAQAVGVDESDVIRQAVHQELARVSFLTDAETRLEKELNQISSGNATDRRRSKLYSALKELLTRLKQ